MNSGTFQLSWVLLLLLSGLVVEHNRNWDAVIGRPSRINAVWRQLDDDDDAREKDRAVDLTIKAEAVGDAKVL